jgi:hypothetical protein
MNPGDEVEEQRVMTFDIDNSGLAHLASTWRRAEERAREMMLCPGPSQREAFNGEQLPR